MRIANRKRHLIGAGLFVIAFFGWTLLYVPRPHPSDKTLIDYFNKHRTDFDRLVSMAREDASVRAIYANEVMLDNYKIWPKSTAEGFSSERWNEYRSVFARLSAYKINSFTNDFDQVQIPVSIADSELDNLEAIVIIKGYAYSLKEPTPLVGSLDEMGFDSRGTYYRSIGEHWYLYHERGVSKPE